MGCWELVLVLCLSGVVMGLVGPQGKALDGRSLPGRDTRDGLSSHMEFQKRGLGNSSLQQNEGRKVLEGVHYKVAVRESPPFVMYNDNASHGCVGYSMDWLDQLSMKLGFSFQVTRLPANIGTEDLVKMVQERKDGINFSIASITLTADRSKKVIFSTPYVDVTLRVIVLQSVSKSSFWQFLEPFSKSAWLGIIGVFTVTFFSLAYLEGQVNDRDFRHDSPIKNCFLGFYHMFVGALQQTTMNAETAEGRLFLSSGLFFFFIISATYTAQLATFLTRITPTSAILDIDNDGIITEQDLRYFSANMTVIQGSPAGNWFHREVRYLTGDEIYCRDLTDCLDQITSGYAVGTVYDGAIAEYAIGTSTKYQRLRLIGAPFYPEGYGLIFSRSEPQQHINFFNKEILEGRSVGFSDDLMKKWFSGVVATAAATDTTNLRLGIRELGGIFAVAWILLALGWLYFYSQKLRILKLFSPPRQHFISLPPFAKVERARELLNVLENTGRLPNESLQVHLLMRVVLESTIESDLAALALKNHSTWSDPEDPMPQGSIGN